MACAIPGMLGRATADEVRERLDYPTAISLGSGMTQMPSTTWITPATRLQQWLASCLS